MSSSAPPPARLWAAFRDLPTGVQVVVWVLGWPVVAALLIASDRGGSRRRYVAAVVVLVLSGSLVAQTTTDATDETTTAGADAAGRAAAAEADRAADVAAEREAEEATQEAAAETVTDAAVEEPAATAVATWTVHRVVDGDTVDVRSPDGTEERVRIIGIDTPERGQCGFDEATAAMTALVLHETVELAAGARDDRDRYDRILRYVDVGGVDAGLSLIEDGLAIARYDSRDGYGGHDREAAYVAADAATDRTCAAPEPAPAPAPTREPTGSTPAPPPSSGPGSGPGGAWRNCAEARDHGAAPVHRGDPGYGSHLDGDDDGVGCE